MGAICLDSASALDSQQAVELLSPAQSEEAEKASDPVMKMFGLGMAVAISVDATIVSIVLVLATMKLMGERQLVAARLDGQVAS